MFLQFNKNIQYQYKNITGKIVITNVKRSMGSGVIIPCTLIKGSWLTLSSLRVNQLLYCVSLKIYNKFANYFVNWNFQEKLTKDPSSVWGCDTFRNIPPCGVALRRTCRCTEFYRVKNANLRHPSAIISFGLDHIIPGTVPLRIGD